MKARTGKFDSSSPREVRVGVQARFVTIIGGLTFLWLLLIPSMCFSQHTYTTNFPGIENPISEGGNWANGGTIGLDWSDCSSEGGLAIGRQSGLAEDSYRDGTAILTGTWGADQSVTATVHTVNQNDDCFEEVELRLRSSLSAHSSTGYEVLFKCSKTNAAYLQIVRWNGPWGDFTYLENLSGSEYGVANGDTIRAAIIGNVITAYVNGVQKAQASDETYMSGSPGMGFQLYGCIGVNTDYGFTTFTASDQPANLGISAAVRVFLEGPFDAVRGAMNNMLYETGMLAAHFPGTAIPSTAVDSITIEIRNDTSAAASSIRKFAPAWLLTDGTIRSFSDTTMDHVVFDTTAGNYYFVIWHRNHLPVMSASAQHLDGAPPAAYDFTAALTQAYGLNAMKQIGTRCVLIAGDADSNLGIGASDIVSARFAVGVIGYTYDDVDMNGGVGASDLLLCRQNVGYVSQVPP